MTGAMALIRSVAEVWSTGAGWRLCCTVWGSRALGAPFMHGGWKSPSTGLGKFLGLQVPVSEKKDRATPLGSWDECVEDTGVLLVAPPGLACPLGTMGCSSPVSSPPYSPQRTVSVAGPGVTPCDMSFGSGTPNHWRKEEVGELKLKVEINPPLGGERPTEKSNYVTVWG